MTERTAVSDLLQAVQTVGEEAAAQGEAGQGRDVLDSGGDGPGPGGHWVVTSGAQQAHWDPTYLRGLQGISLETEVAVSQNLPFYNVIESYIVIVCHILSSIKA